MNRFAHHIFGGAMLGLVLSQIGCSKDHPLESRAATPLPVVPVRTLVASNDLRTATEEVVGTVRPKLSAVIAAKVSGTVAQVLVAPGSQVKAGDWLAQLEAREIQARLDQALAVREQTQGDIQRFTKLLADKAVTQQEFEAVQSRQRVAQAAVAEAETMLGYTRITAPFAGVITRKFVDVGDLATPGKPLFEMEDPRDLRMEAYVPEAAVSRLQLEAQLAVRIASVTNMLEGVVSEIAPAADPNSRTFLVKVDLPASKGLRSGQFGRVEIPVAEVRAMRLPMSAVVQRGQMEMVFVVTNQQAQMRLVKTGKQFGPFVELVSGINPGEQIVVTGAERLADGQPVKVEL